MYDRIKTFPCKFSQKRKVLTSIFFYIFWIYFSITLIGEFAVNISMRYDCIDERMRKDVDIIFCILCVATVIEVIALILYIKSRTKFFILFAKDEDGNLYKIKIRLSHQLTKKHKLTCSQSVASDKELVSHIITDKDFCPFLFKRKKYTNINLVKIKRKYIILEGTTENHNGDDKVKRFKVYKYIEGYGEFIDTIFPVDL